MDRDDLIRAASQVDVVELAGRIIANPSRAMCSEAGKLAMAYAVEAYWEICVEANLLVTLLERSMPWDEPTDAELCETVALQAGHIRALLARLRGDTNTDKQEQTDGR